MENIAASTQGIDQCLVPIDGIPCGINPLYHDDFEAVKLEIEKLSGCNYEFILKQCTCLLTNTSKDLRVAGYLCLALTWKQQAQGLIAGLTLYKNLLIQYADSLHPQNENARLSALKWLNNPRFIALLNAKPVASPQVISQLQETITDFKAAIQTYLGDRFQTFTILDLYLASIETKSAPPTTSRPVLENTPKKKNTLIQSQPEDSQQAFDLQKQLIHYWQTEKQWLLACQLARSLRWNELSPPPDKNKKTNITPLRKEGMQSLEKALKKDDPQAILSQCESLFLEPGGQYFLDLQYHAHQAALRLDLQDLADYLLQQSRWLCTHHPHLSDLAFSDDKPFASLDTQQWLDNKATDEPPHAALEKTVDVYLKQVNIQDKFKDLNAILKQLQEENPQTALEQLRLLQASARACKIRQQYDLAMIYYQELLSVIDRQQFALWHKQEALSLWQEILSFTENKGHLVLSTEDIRQQAFQLKKKICLQGAPP